MDEDYLYENAPLIEVIAEVFWQLTPIRSVPGAAIDPYFAATSNGFRTAAGKLGYTHVERLVPEEAPLELVAKEPVFRFRRSPGAWPLYQIGPGIFTCNIVPPYNGWAEFRKVISAGLDLLFAAFPVPEKQFKTETVALRYIDGFGAAHGVGENFVQFTAQQLGFSIGLRDGLLARFASDPAKAVASMHVRFPLREPSQAHMALKISPGRKDGQRAVIADLRVTGTGAGAPKGLGEDILNWLDSSHRTLHDIFDMMTSEELKRRMGPKKPVGGARAEG